MDIFTFRQWKNSMRFTNTPGDGGAAGGGAGGGSGGGGGTANPPAFTLPPEVAAQMKSMQDEIAALKAGGVKPPEKKPDDLDLNEKARIEREAAAKKVTEAKDLEAALTFNLQSKDFLKTNAALLPKEAAELFAQAEKETYGSAVEKVQALKAGLIQSFFAVQSNRDLLTPSQMANLDEYLKLTKTEKQTRAPGMYDTIFEPTFEAVKRLKKADALSKGLSVGGGSDDAYRMRLHEDGMKHYGLGEKK